MNSRERLIETVVGPLADNVELQMAARQQIEAELSPQAEEGELAAAVEKLERTGKGRWRWVWAAAVLGVSVVMLAGPVGKMAVAWLEARSIMAPLTHLSVEPRHSFRESLSEQDRLLLFGDESALPGADQWRPLWESDPGNAMYYAMYAVAYESEHDAVPPDFLATGERIDPGNGWFALKAVATGAEAVVERDSRTWKERQAGKKPTWTVKDEAELARRIALLKQGALSEKIESYHQELTALRFGKLPQAGEFIEAVPVIAYMAGTTIDLMERQLTDLILAEARRCAREGDRAGFRELAEAWERLFQARLQEANTLVECLILNANLGSALPVMGEVAETLEMKPSLWKSREERWQARRDLLDSRRDGPEQERFGEMINRHGSMVTSLSLPLIGKQLIDPPDLTPGDLLPATRVEQALLGRVMSVAGWTVLALFGLVSLGVTATQARFTGRLAKSLGRMLDLRDVCWIGAAGVLVPLLIYLGLRYGTPLARLDWGPQLTMYGVSVAHFVGLLLMWTVWPVVIAEWRAQRCGRVLGWKRPGWWAASALAAPPAGMLCFSFAVPPGPWTQPLIAVGSALGGWSLVWWLARGWAGAFGNREGRVRRQVIARAARPAWLGAMLAMAGLVHHFHAEERRWFARDEVMRPVVGFTAYEAEVTARLKDELREVME